MTLSVALSEYLTEFIQTQFKNTDWDYNIVTREYSD